MLQPGPDTCVGMGHLALTLLSSTHWTGTRTFMLGSDYAGILPTADICIKRIGNSSQTPYGIMQNTVC